MTTFRPFPKIARFSREIIVTEKIDGTNAQIHIGEDGKFLVGSRNRWITPEDDNHGFAKWAHDNKDELMKLGPGQHFGEWYGSGIQRGYGLNEKRFALFNVTRWAETRPSCCGIVPVLYQGIMGQENIEEALDRLYLFGSRAAPGFMKPEGIVIFHTAAQVGFKKTIDKDDEYKGKQK